MTDRYSGVEGPALCLLRQMRSAEADQVPPRDVINALASPAARGCRIGQCLIRGADLLRSEYDAPEAIPSIDFQEPKELAPPECTLFDPLHAG